MEAVWLGETESDLVGGELVIAVHNGIKLVLHGVFVEWVKLNLLVFLTVKGNSDGFTGDVRWEADIVKNLEVDSGEGSGSWSHLGWMVLGSWGDDGSVGDNEDWLLVLFLKVLLDEGSNLLEGSVGSVWDSHEEILGR